MADGMRIRLAIPDELDDQERREALNAALESVTRSNEGLIKRGKVPFAAQGIKEHGVRWQPEPPGDESFDLASTVMRRGWGDCDDLAPWHAASLRATGRDSGARAVVSKSGPQRWHAWVLRSDGSKEDPSKAAGMSHSVSGGPVGGAAPLNQPMSADGRLCLAICPQPGDPQHARIWFVRCDAPDRCEPFDWSVMSAHTDPRRALLHAITGMRTVAGDDLDGEDEAKLMVVNDLLLGADPIEIADALDAVCCGEDGEPTMDVDGVMDDAMQSVGFLGLHLHNIAHALSPLAHLVTAPISSAVHAAQAVPSVFKHGFHPERFVKAAVNPFAHAASEALHQGADVMHAAHLDQLAKLASKVPGLSSIPGVQLLSQLGPLMNVLQHPSLQSLLQAGLPLAGGMFMPGFGGMAGSALADMLKQHQRPGWAPPAFGFHPGQVMQAMHGGPAFLRF